MMIEKVVADTLQQGHSAPADTLRSAAQASAEHGEKFDFNHLLEHLHDSRELEIPFGHVELPHFPPVQIGEYSIDLSVTKHVFFLLFAGLLLTLMAVYASRKI
ncbi:MAG TPA: hypothetical protein VJB38_02330, partial [Bacteroidota bacterium]|nr:hypothetical protein [Bacteroidota bacterium]